MAAMPSGYLLDTNVVSEVMRPRPARSVAEWIETTPEELLYLSVITIGEIRPSARYSGTHVVRG
jgi:predicted nucleic acid-binding protein